MARKLPKNPRIKRRSPKREVQKLLIIVCEGKNTEPDYLKQLARDKKHNLIEYITHEEAGSPKSIVNLAIKQKKIHTENAKKTKNSFDGNFEIWCVSDRDEHLDLVNQMNRARDNGLHYILSNPCIELWGYLHYHQNDAPTHRHVMQRKLKEVMPDYDHNSGAIFNYEDMKENYDTAVARAKELIQRRIDEDDPHGDPSTNIYELTESFGYLDVNKTSK